MSDSNLSPGQESFIQWIIDEFRKRYYCDPVKHEEELRQQSSDKKDATQ
jgi:hypothetical protein